MTDKRFESAEAIELELSGLVDALRGKLKQLSEARENHACDLPGKTMRRVQVEALTKCLRRKNGSREETARELRIARSSVFLWIKEWNVSAPPDLFGRLLCALPENVELRTESLQTSSSDDDGLCLLTGKSMEAIEIEVLTKCLRRQRGNREAAALELDLARSTVFARIAKYGIAVARGFDPAMESRTPDRARSEAEEASPAMTDPATSDDAAR